MEFSAEQRQIFNKNLENLIFLKLKDKLSKITEVKNYEVKFGADALDINIFDKTKNAYLLDESLNESLAKFNAKKFYPVLYFYGFGNGILFKALLLNSHLKHIVVFEPNIEILYIMLHLVDFSKEFDEQKIIVFDDDLDSHDYTQFFSQKPFVYFLRIFNLELYSKYYESFDEKLQILINEIATHIKQVILNFGNDMRDNLTGFKQSIANLPFMFENFRTQDILKAYKEKYETAIIVATGPSLIKQLEILKKYQNKALILCADSSYPILAKHNIKPNIVFSSERVQPTSKFFDNDFGEFDKEILFLITSHTHEDSVKFLKNKRYLNIALEFPALRFYTDFGFHQYGYELAGSSVANLAFNFAVSIYVKNIILIGQDLAYADDGASHPDCYTYGKFDLGDRVKSKEYQENRLQVKAYGGEGFVYTQEVWNYFRVQFERDIACFDVCVYNATQGGARIKGAIEIAFNEICEKLLKDEIKFEIPPLNAAKYQKQMLLKAFYKLNVFINRLDKFEFDCAKSLNDIGLLSDNFTNFKLENINEIFARIDEFKQVIDDISQGFIGDCLYCYIINFEMSLAQIYILMPKTQEEVLQKQMFWISEHIKFIDMVLRQSGVFKQNIKESMKNLENALINQGLEKRMQKIINKFS